MIIYKGNDIQLTVKDVSGYKEPTIKLFTNGATVVSKAVTSTTMCFDASELEPLASGVVAYYLTYYIDDAAFADGKYNQTDTVYTDIYYCNTDQQGDSGESYDDAIARLQEEIDDINAKLEGGVKAICDDKMSAESESPVQNKAITAALDNYATVDYCDTHSAVAYRLVVSSQVFKADTTSVTIGLTKSEGGTVTDLSVLPTGWKIGVAYSSGESTKSEVLSAPGSIDPHAWSEVAISLCDGDPSLSATNVLDQATLRLVSDGAKGDKGDVGALTNYPIVECAGEIVLSDCYPNRIYKADSAITTLSVDVIYYSDGTNGTDFSAHGNIADEYVFDFIAGASCSVQLPEAVVWAATPSFSEGKRYVISIVDNLGLCAEYTI